MLNLPDRAGSLVDDVLDLATLVGKDLDPWQVTSIDGITSVDERGFWVCTEFGELVARQNGKGDIINLVNLAKLYLWRKPDGSPRTIVYTAHQFKTAREMFRRCRMMIQSSAVLFAELKDGHRGIRTSHGEEGFELSSGNRLLFLARSQNSGVGFTIDDLTVDEAQQCSQNAMDGFLPTMSAVENKQVTFFGTAPDELNDADYFEGVRDRGRAGTAPRTGWIEFSPPGSDDPDTAEKLNIYDLDNTLAANPGFGYRPGLNISQVVDEMGEPGVPGRLSVESYKVQRLSVWPNRREQGIEHLSDLDLDRWKKNCVPDAALGDASVIAVALGRGGGFVTVSAASRFDDDLIFVEHKRTDRGTVWAAQYIKDLKAELNDALVVLDPKNASPLLVDLQDLGVKYLPMNMDELAAAHSGFIERANAALIVHRGQEEVTRSLEFAAVRPIGRSGFTWDQSDPRKPVSHAQSVTWAAWGLRKFEALPKKRPKKVRGYA